MRSTIYTILATMPGLGLILGVVCCGKSDMDTVPLRYADYTEGPHITIQAENCSAAYFTLQDRAWHAVESRLECDATVSVENPITDPFEVHLRRPAETPPPAFYPAADSILVVADIEGSFVGLYTLLLSQGVIDSSMNWTYGTGHLVMLGDIFDRGPDVTPVLWLLYKLEDEARLANGNVHTLLGNHEMMIFGGDTRYIHAKYENLRNQLGTSYSHLFSNTTILGQWLRDKQAVIRIGDRLFAHAGISVDVMRLALSLEEINEVIQRQNDQRTVQSDANTDVLLGTNGVFWYRGWVDDPPAEAVLEGILGMYDASSMVVGHTIVPQLTITYDDKLIACDIRQNRDRGEGIVRALRINGNRMTEVDNVGGHQIVRSPDEDSLSKGAVRTSGGVLR